MTKTTTMRKGAAALVLAVGVLAITGTGAGAAVESPAILDGFANSQALKIKLVVPALDDLKASLIAAGIPITAVPNTNVAGVSLEQAISVNSGNARKQGATAASSGFAAAGIGALVNRSARSSCSSSSCTEGESTAVLAKTQLLGPANPPTGIGSIEIAPSNSMSSTFLDTKNRTGLIAVELDARDLLGPNGTLSVVGNALTTLANTVNSAVLPVVNPAVQSFIDTIDGLDAIKPVRDELYRYATLGQIKPLPDPAATKLLSLDVLSGTANVGQEVRGNTNGLLSTASSNIADLKVLGGWVSVDSARLTSTAYANGTVASADATNNALIAGATLGGLLNVDISKSDLKRLTDPETLKNVLRETVPGLDTQVEDVAAAIDLVYNIAGVSVDFLPSTKSVQPNGRFARAEAGTLRITIAPQIPILANGVTPAGSAVPRLAADDYVPTGLKLTIDLPSTEVQASAGEVKCVGRCGSRTGVGTAWGAIMLLFGGAFLVKRFGLAASN